MKLYGSRRLGLDELKDVAAAALDLDFESRHSYYLCGDYWRARVQPSGKVIVLANCLEDDGEHLESRFPEHSALLRVEADLDETPLQGIEGLELLETHD